MLRTFFLSFFSFLFFFSQAQSYPQDYFRSPLDIPLFLSGNFGELRSNHFHAGIDIKTAGVEGQKIYAVADGYVSRIKVSPYGYGNALYITHPNGYTSVYGHLKKYNDKLTAYIKDNQYKQESFEVQLFPSLFAFPVKKGDLIAYSGNSGSSGGPHLHFEIRDTKTEHPIDPLLFGFDLKDNINPDIYAITIFPLNKEARINGANQAKRYKATGQNGKYRLLQQTPILVSGEIGFGIESVDRMNGAGNSYGLHQIELRLDSQLIFQQKINEFSFDEGRYINALIDYKTYIAQRRRVQRSFVLPGNQLRFYTVLKNKGKVTINKPGEHKLTYQVSDIKNNRSTIDFNVVYMPESESLSSSTIHSKAVKFFKYNERNTFVEDNFLVDLPAHVLYEDIYFEYREEAPLSGALSPTYWIHNHYTPLHKHITVSIKLPPLEEQLKKKAVVFSTVDGKSKYAEGGEWNGLNISVKTRSFAGYGVALDTIQPQIRPINIFNNADMSSKWSIQVKINDNFSGIGSYNGYIDGKWVLMEYDAKNNLLTHYFDERTSKGVHEFKLVVNDKVENQSIYQVKFKR
ncbi:MAG: M23 family peptidase [Bacteroidetes bacterium]|nr:MAG: M23 family peptidase [Bacteroidota bacterium]MBL1144924.1 M23 family metallopeptidase [Bacteroidota bacterium]MCB0803206.1 M23 family metallopeptidase [Flavobacteriales bacterium]NOG57718.1 M23 family metallopeptidase [Bacteroidota bacterium]